MVSNMQIKQMKDESYLDNMEVNNESFEIFKKKKNLKTEKTHSLIL